MSSNFKRFAFLVLTTTSHKRPERSAVLFRAKSKGAIPDQALLGTAPFDFAPQSFDYAQDARCSPATPLARSAGRGAQGAGSFRDLLILLCLQLLLAACNAAPVSTPTPLPTSTTVPTPTTAPTPTPVPPFRVIGYTSFSGFAAAALQLDKVTHINYAFLIPNADGTFVDMGQSQGLGQLAATAHKHNIKVLISVGGWGYDAQFEQFAADPALRSNFVAALVQFIQKYNLDGADIDWEYPDAGASGQNFTDLMHELSLALRPQGKLLTAAVPALGSNADPISPEVFDDVDFLNIMAYDGPDLNHSSYEYAEDALAYWAGRGLPAAQTVLGVPFYARPLEVPYRKLVDSDAKALDSDQIDYFGTTVYYNGAPTLRRKTELAKQQASGIMIWTLEEDSPGEASLLKAIYEAAKP